MQTKIQRDRDNHNAENQTPDEFFVPKRSAAIAQRQTSTSDSPSLQRHSTGKAHGKHHHDEDKPRRKKIRLQRHEDRHPDTNYSDSFAANDNIENRIKSSQGRGKPLDESVRRFMEPRFGSSFDRVNVHTGSEAVQMNRDLHAHAFTHGNDIYFNQGKYNPGSASGKELLAHELTHTIQQTGGVALKAEENRETVKVQRKMVQRKDKGHQKNCSCPECDTGKIQRQSISGVHQQDCGCNTCVPNKIQRQSDRSANLQGENLLQRITKKPNEIKRSEIQRQTSSHGKGCGCSTCKTGIQTKLTVGAAGDKYEQEADRTAKKVMRMSDLKTGSRSSRGKWHEEETAQRKLISNGQEGIAQRQTIASQVTATGDNTIQRHSSHEHYLLGNSSPDDLKDISIMRELGALKKKVEKEGGSLADVSLEKAKLFEEKYASIKHTIQQHINLLKNFIETPDFLDEKENRTAKDGTELDPGEIYKADEAPDWEIPYISLPVKKEKGAEAASDSVVVMYGELNALPDFFGSPLDIADTPKAFVLKLVQGIRQRVYKNLLHWYNDEIVQSEKEKIKDETKKGKGDFKDAAGPKYADKTARNEDYFEDVKERSGGENDQGTELGAHQASMSTGDKTKDQNYFAALERNACHFAPDSWNTWKKYHEEALKAAEDANYHRTMRKSLEGTLTYGYGTITEKDVEKERNEELKFNNKALLLNAFGDHFLQDSYAAGHLVDKTVIMAEFAKWMDRKGIIEDMMPDDRAVMIRMVGDKISEDEDVARKMEPQDFQDKLQSGKFFKEDEDEDEDEKKGPYEKAAISLGLPPDLPVMFLMWWRQQYVEKKVKKHAMAADLVSRLKESDSKPDKDFPTDVLVLEKKVLDPLLHLGAIHKKKSRTGGFMQYSINKAVIRQVTGSSLLSKKTPSYLSEVAKENPYDYKELASEFNVQAYGSFMERTVIQTISNHFHDIYCRKGLNVHSRGGTKIGLIYGDKDMLSKGAGEGVKYASETGRLSRDAIIKTAQGIMLDKEEHTKNIEQRFPGKVEVESKKYSLKDWNTKVLATNENFQDAWDNNPKLQKLKKAKSVGLGRMSLGGLFAKFEEKPDHPGQLF